MIASKDRTPGLRTVSGATGSSLCDCCVRYAAIDFSGRIQPDFSREFPEVCPSATVAIGSSVSYGIADEFSDLDVFVVLSSRQEHRLREVQNWFGQWPAVPVPFLPEGEGLNYEVTTWPRLDLHRFLEEDLPASEWLHGQRCYQGVFFLQHLVPLHDPQAVLAGMQQRTQSMPREVMDQLVRAEFWGFLACREELLNAWRSDRPVHWWLARRKFCQHALPLAYFVAGTACPHAKWRFALLPRLSDFGLFVQRCLASLGQAREVATALPPLEELTEALRQRAAVPSMASDAGPLPHTTVFTSLDEAQALRLSHRLLWDRANKQLAMALRRNFWFEATMLATEVFELLVQATGVIEGWAVLPPVRAVEVLLATEGEFTALRQHLRQLAEVRTTEEAAGLAFEAWSDYQEHVAAKGLLTEKELAEPWGIEVSASLG